DSRLRRRERARVDDRVGAEPAGQLQAGRDAVDDDHRARAHVPSHRGGVQTEAAGALEDDRVPEAEAALAYTVDDLREGAVSRGNHVVAQLVGHGEDVVAGAQVEILGKGAGEVRRSIG